MEERDEDRVEEKSSAPRYQGGGSGGGPRERLFPRITSECVLLSASFP